MDKTAQVGENACKGNGCLTAWNKDVEGEGDIEAEISCAQCANTIWSGKSSEIAISSLEELAATA